MSAQDDLTKALASSLAPALAAALAPLVAPLVATHLRQLQLAGAEELSQSAAAVRAGKAETTISQAVQLPAKHPGHLPSRVCGAATGALAGRLRRAIKVADLDDWCACGGAAHARAAINANDSGAKTSGLASNE